jgi:hypothetical protein
MIRRKITANRQNHCRRRHYHLLNYAHIIGFCYFIYPPEYVRALPRRSLFSYQITKSHKIQGLGFIGSFADAGQFANCFVLHNFPHFTRQSGNQRECQDFRANSGSFSAIAIFF